MFNCVFYYKDNDENKNSIIKQILLNVECLTKMLQKKVPYTREFLLPFHDRPFTKFFIRIYYIKLIEIGTPYLM